MITTRSSSSTSTKFTELYDGNGNPFTVPMSVFNTLRKPRDEIEEEHVDEDLQ